MPYGSKLAIPTRPLSDLNMTPLIDVLLVLIVMIIITVPLMTHSLDVPLPNGDARYPIESSNTVTIDARDRLYWNGQKVDRQDLLNQLAASTRLLEQPTLRFEPDALASYDRSAKTIALIKDAGVTNFAFVGNQQYRTFGRGD